MKIKLIISLLIFLFVFGFGGCASLKVKNEALSFYQQGQKALEQKKYQEALNYFGQSLKIYQSYNLEQGVAASLVSIGEVYRFLNKYEDALNSYKEALSIYKKLNIHDGIATSITNIGLVYQSLKRYDDALNYHKEALRIYRELNVPQYIATSLNNIGWVYQKLGKPEDTLKYYEDALEISRKLNISKDTAITLHNIGSVYFSLNKYDKSLHYYEEALKINRRLNLLKEIAMDLNQIGIVYSSLSQYDKALKYHREALKIRNEINDLKMMAQTFNNLGDTYRSMGQYAEALENLEFALLIERKLNNSIGVALGLHNIAGVYDELGRYDKTLKYCEEAFTIFKELNNKKYMALSFNCLAGVSSSLGQYEKALQYYEESLKIRMELNVTHDIATTLNNIGNVYSSIGRHDESLKYYGEALNLRIKLNLSQDISDSFYNIGAVYLALKNYKKVEELYKNAEEELAKAGFEDWQIKAIRNPPLVDFYIAIKKYDEALKFIRQYVEPDLSSTQPYLIQYYTQRGLAFQGIGNLKEASIDFLKAVSLIEDMRQKVKGEKTGFFSAGGAGGRIRAYRGIVETLSTRAIECKMQDKECMYKEFSPYGKDLSSTAFYFSESTKARTLLEAMAESARKSQKVELPEELREKEQAILNQLSAIENQWDDAYKRGEDVLRRLKDRKDGLNAELNNLINELRQKYPRYASLYYPRPIPPEELPLKDNEVLLEYAIGDDAGYLFVVQKGGVKRLIKTPFSREELEAKVKAFIEPMNNRQIERFSVKEARELYDLLLAEAMKEIDSEDRSQKSDNIKKIIIVPDGILGLLPFEALVIKEGKDYKDSLYVGDRYQISYYQSATVLALQRNLKERKTERPLFALANPIYTKEDPRYVTWKENKKATMVAGLDKYSFRGIAIKAKWGKTTEADTTGKEIEFPPLPETEIEVKEIAKMMNVSPEPPDVLLSARANETELRKTGLDKYKYIHFATHASLPGMIQGLNEPFILLGQVENDNKDDGFLTLTEVLDLRLNADIVVLSACVTGVGKEVEGEGVANFARAFQHAGAKSVVVSLWEVASEPAVEYMKKFYEYLKAGKSRGDALRLARNEIKTKYPNPFYWAVFILHGEG